MTRRTRTPKPRAIAASESTSLATAARRMLALMAPAERRRLWWLTPIVTANAVVQVVGIASVMPFLSLIANPEAIDEQPLLARALNELIRFHRDHGKLATVTAVRPPSRFGNLAFTGDLVTDFYAKHDVDDTRINGGYFVLEPSVIDYVDGDDVPW